MISSYNIHYHTDTTNYDSMRKAEEIKWVRAKHIGDLDLDK